MNNTLCTYEGGGYDGCFWEYNFFVFDKKGKFHDVFSSGYKGITTENGAKELLSNSDEQHYITDLYSEKDIDKFQREYNEGLVIGITNEIVNLIEQGIDIDPIWWTCDECGKRVEYGGKGADYAECGGIVIHPNTKLCDECYWIQYCKEEEDNE